MFTPNTQTNASLWLANVSIILLKYWFVQLACLNFGIDILYIYSFILLARKFSTAFSTCCGVNPSV
jgi:hypothetical protein